MNILDAIAKENEEFDEEMKRLGIAAKYHEALVEALKDLMASICGGKKSCGHDFPCVCAGDNARTLLNKIREE